MSLGVIFCVCLFLSVTNAQICSFRLHLEDSGADGWNDNRLQIQVNGVDVGFTYPDGSHQSFATILLGPEADFAFNAHNGDVVQFAYNASGKYPTENQYYFRLSGSDDASIYSGQGSSTGTIDQFTASCCCVPGQVTGLHVQSQSAGRVTVNWDNTSNSDVYRLFRKSGPHLFDTLGDFTWSPQGVDLAIESDISYQIKISGGNSIGYGPMSPALRFQSAPLATSCIVTLVMLDTYGAGWDDGYVDVYVNGAIVLHGTSAAERTAYTFQVAAEPVAFATDVVASSWPEDLEYAIYRDNTRLFYSGWGGSGVSNINATLNLCTSHGLSSIPKRLEEMDVTNEVEDAQNRLFANGDTCHYRVTVRDDYGDGWSAYPGSWCTVEMRMGTGAWSVLNDYLRVNTTQQTVNTWEFDAIQPAEIRINWTAGNDHYPFDDSYRVDLIVNGLPGDTPIIFSPANPSDASAVPVATQSFFASCGASQSTCSSFTNCPSLNRNPCQNSFNPPSCGTCLSGYTTSSGTGAGNTQCTDINECSSSPCSVNARCTNSAGSFSCACNSGYTGDGFTCTPISSTCSSITNCPSLNRAPCQSTFNPPSCGACLSGYTGSATGNTACADINECASNPGPCDTNAQCTNTAGSYGCQCNSGYTGNGFTCTATCALFPTSTCTALYRNPCQGSFSPPTCGSCFSGYTGSATGSTACVPVSSSTCAYRITVTDDYGDGWYTNPGSYCSVESRPGSTGAWTVLNANLKVSTTQQTINTWDFTVTQSSQVRVNWTQANDPYPFDDNYRVDLVSGSTTTQIIYSPADNTDSSAVPVASQSYTANCGGSPSSCSSITNCPSLNRNPCQSSFNPPACGSCYSGYTGSATGNTACADINECQTSSPCSVYASCQNLPGTYNCTCNSGFTGNGVTCNDINECSSAPCSVNAKCTNSAGTFSCACNSGYTGDGFTCSPVQTCSGITNCPSLNRASCQSTFNPPTCGACLSGYTGSPTIGNTLCSDINECQTSSPCSFYASCQNLPGTYNCTCNSGFTGNGVTCNDINECSSNPCSVNARCSNSPGTYTCTCNSGFTGNGVTCTDINECASSPCATNARCTNQIGGYNCSCNSGYTGDGFTCTPIQTCSSITNCPSLNRASCQSTFNPPSCGACLSGFSGTPTIGNTQCNDINECSSNPSPCSTNAKCQNSNGGYSCTCNSGWTGNGVTCTDINECANNPCSTNAVCQNSAGSYSCTCNSGYVGDGFTCTPDIGTCPSIRLRQEWFDLTPQLKDRWLRAVRTMYDAGNYGYFSDKHSQFASIAHGRALFLPWHRSFLWEFENALRGLGGEFTCIVQPYYDWSNPSTISTMFTASKTSGYWTGVGDKGGALDGIFAGFNFGSAVTRSSVTSFQMQREWTIADSLRPTSYATIRPTIEGYHNNFHIWVGGTMNVIATSPRDPIFFLHHTNVDQQWAVWEYCNGYSGYSTQADLTSRASFLWDSASPNSFTGTMGGYSIAPWRTYNIEVHYGYRYTNTFLSRAFNGGTSLSCPDITSSWFRNPGSSRRLLGDTSNQAHPYRGAYIPTPEYYAEQRQIFETFKDAILNGEDLDTAYDRTVTQECLLDGPHQRLLFTPEHIAEMNMEDLCSQGGCINPCWKKLDGRRDDQEQQDEDQPTNGNNTTTTTHNTTTNNSTTAPPTNQGNQGSNKKNNRQNLYSYRASKTMRRRP